MPTSRNARCFCFWLSGECIIFFFLLTKKCTNSCPVWPLKKKRSYKCVECDMPFISSFAFLSVCAEHGAGHCFLPQSPWHEPPGVPHVILLIVVFVIPLPEPCVGFTAHSRPRHSETALPRRQTPQGHQWAGGDGEDLRQSQYNFLPHKSASDSSVSVSIWWTCHNYCKRHAEHWHSFHVVWVMFRLGFFWFLSVLCNNSTLNSLHINRCPHMPFLSLPWITDHRLILFMFLSCVFQDLSCLIECYLTPLQKESFLTQDEVLFFLTWSV